MEQKWERSETITKIIWRYNVDGKKLNICPDKKKWEMPFSKTNEGERFKFITSLSEIEFNPTERWEIEADIWESGIYLVGKWDNNIRDLICWFTLLP